MTLWDISCWVTAQADSLGNSTSCFLFRLLLVAAPLLEVPASWVFILIAKYYAVLIAKYYTVTVFQNMMQYCKIIITITITIIIIIIIIIKTIIIIIIIILNWPLPKGAFQDQCKQIFINEHNDSKNPNWLEANQLAIYKLWKSWIWGSPKTNSSLEWQGGGFESRTARLQVQRPITRPCLLAKILCSSAKYYAVL